MNARRAGNACGVLLAFAVCLFSQPGPAPLIVGTWKLNAGKSNLRVPPDFLEIRQYRMRPDGFLVGLLFTKDARGYHYLQFTAKSDGRDYPEYSDQITA